MMFLYVPPFVSFVLKFLIDRKLIKTLILLIVYYNPDYCL
jgi:hypothetical protein